MKLEPGSSRVTVLVDCGYLLHLDLDDVHVPHGYAGAHCHHRGCITRLDYFSLWNVHL